MPSFLFSIHPKAVSNIPENEVKLPDGTFWVETNDARGVWVNVENVHNHKNNATLALYDGITKEFIERKRFSVICTSTPSEFIWIENLEEQIKIYDKGVFRFDSDKCWLQ